MPYCACDQSPEPYPSSLPSRGSKQPIRDSDHSRRTRTLTDKATAQLTTGKYPPQCKTTPKTSIVLAGEITPACSRVRHQPQRLVYHPHAAMHTTANIPPPRTVIETSSRHVVDAGSHDMQRACPDPSYTSHCLSDILPATRVRGVSVYMTGGEHQDPDTRGTFQHRVVRSHWTLACGFLIPACRRMIVFLLYSSRPAAHDWRIYPFQPQAE